MSRLDWEYVDESPEQNDTFCQRAKVPGGYLYQWVAVAETIIHTCDGERRGARTSAMSTTFVPCHSDTEDTP